MSHYDDTGQKSSGPMGPIEKHHVVCRDCSWEDICSTEWAADSVARGHRGEHDHTVQHARIE